MSARNRVGTLALVLAVLAAVIFIPLLVNNGSEEATAESIPTKAKHKAVIVAERAPRQESPRATKRKRDPKPEHTHVEAPAPSPEPAPAPVEGVGNATVQCESGGDYGINTGNGYYGGYQFDSQTWDAYGDPAYGEAHEAPPAVQDQAAASVPYDAWPNC